MSARPEAAFGSGSGGELAEFALAASTSTRCHVIVEVTSHLNQRWARSSLTTNGSTLDVTVTAIAFDERADGIAAASVSESVSGLEGLIDVVHAADAAALAASPAEDAGPFPAPVAATPTPPTTCCWSTSPRTGGCSRSPAPTDPCRPSSRTPRSSSPHDPWMPSGSASSAWRRSNCCVRSPCPVMAGGTIPPRRCGTATCRPSSPTAS